jgi:hypothetical protein
MSLKDDAGVRLKKLFDLYSSKNKKYGGAYKNSGKVFIGLFPNGLMLSSELDFLRYAIFSMMITKMIRYSKNFECGSKDSLEDLAVYSQMLSELDDSMNTEI